ncbi:MAG: hypothetical protein IJ229_03645 [Clostridia bacterium]|nr:hypothetical protein [Clostridia bacterium]MBR1683503.1 hypothetical protein [Clostridia bacterium]
MIAHSCPNCGAPVIGASSLQIFTCAYCGSRIEPTPMQLELEKKRLEEEQRAKEEEQKAKEEERKRNLEEWRKKKEAEAEELRAFNERQSFRRWQEGIEDVYFKCAALRWLSRFLFLISLLAYTYPVFFPHRWFNRFVFLAAIWIRLKNTKKAAEKKAAQVPL